MFFAHVWDLGHTDTQFHAVSLNLFGFKPTYKLSANRCSAEDSKDDLKGSQERVPLYHPDFWPELSGQAIPFCEFSIARPNGLLLTHVMSSPAGGERAQDGAKAHCHCRGVI